MIYLKQEGTNVRQNRKDRSEYMFWKQRFLEDIHDAYESGYKAGFYKGYKEGFDKGRRKRIIELYRKEIISIEIAMSELNMTKEEIEKEMSETS